MCQAQNDHPATNFEEKAKALALEALRTTAGNIRSLGPTGVLGPYAEWLRQVETAIKGMEQQWASVS